jgi:magnesium transporter
VGIFRYFLKKKTEATGVPPGLLIPPDKEEIVKPGIHLFKYSRDRIEEENIEDVKGLKTILESKDKFWVNITGLKDVDTIEAIGNTFSINPLILEDIMNTGGRPKIEDMSEYVFVILNMIDFDGSEMRVDIEQVSIILGKNYVITFQESEGDVFEPVRDRIKNSESRIRKLDADYLFYVVMDVIVDNYFLTLERLGEYIEVLEEGVINEPKPETVHSINEVKRDLLFLRQSIWPLREIISFLLRSDLKQINEATGIYMRDLYDHTIEVMDLIETFRDVISGLLDTYLSSINNRMNEVMKVLTVIATIFIPLTFITGLFGMNFKYIFWDFPIWDWKWSFPLIMIGMTLITLLLMVYFRVKKWL